MVKDKIRMADENKDRHIPQHPLPTEIRKMDKGETVCKFCGVSYLIHHEMKLLEDRVKAAEEELQYYKGAVEREARLKEEVKRYQEAIDEYDKTLRMKEQLISSLTLDSKRLDDEILDLKHTKQVLEDKMVEAIRDGEKYKSSFKSMKSKLPVIKRGLSDQKKAVHDVRSTMTSSENFLHQSSERINDVLSKFLGTQAQEMKMLQVQVDSLQTQNTALQNKEGENQKAMGAQFEEIKQLQQSESQLQELRQKYTNLEQELRAKEEQLENEVAKTRMITIQSEQYKEQLSTKTKEVESAVLAVRATEKSLEQSIEILQEKLRTKEGDWRESKAECLKLMRQLDEQKAMGQESNRKAAMSQSEREELKQSLVRSQEELSNLKAEREAMINAHQNRIEQLRESFKRKMSEAEKWPEKMEETLRKEREQHKSELQSVEEKLKENFIMEMQIEKQKHQELIEKYTKESKETENRLKSQLLTSMHNTHKAEVEDLQRLLKETRERAKSMEDQLRMEIESLKKIIKDLEERLGRVDLGSQEQVVALQLEAKEKDAELANLRTDLSARENQLGDMKEEIGFLQNTVRSECEERFELTEALSLAREELLALKMPAGGYQTPNNISRTSSVTSASESSRRGSLTNNAVLPHPPQVSQREPVNSNNVTVGFEGEGANSSKSHFKGKSISESRKRIAAAVGRR